MTDEANILDNTETNVAVNANQPDGFQPTGSLEIREKLGHRWWLWTLLIPTLIAPFVVLTLAILTNKFGSLPGLYLITILVLLLGNFFRAIWHYNYQAYERVHEDRKSDVGPAEWSRVNWKDRCAPLLRGLVRLEFFGWIVWVSTSTTGIAGALRNTAISLNEQHNKGLLQNTTLDLLSAWYGTLNDAAYDLVRATVIGAIVLFFAQLIRKFQTAIDKNDQAARESSEAAQQAREAATRAYAAITEAKALTPGLEQQLARTMNAIASSYNFIEGETLFHNFARTLQTIAESSPALAQVKELSRRLTARGRQINEEITHSYTTNRATRPTDPFDLISLSAIYTTYLKVETLSFEGAQVGRKGCRLSTRYPHYALIVRSVVEALHELDQDRYRFYTIFNRAPLHFFNPENPNVDRPLANFNWSAFFLEEFCRKRHHEQKMPYTRYFITLVDDSKRPGLTGKIPPTLADLKEEIPKTWILCNVRANTFTPCLWGESAWTFFSEETTSPLHTASQPSWAYPSIDELTAMRTAAREAIPPKETWDTLSSLRESLELRDPSYVIATGNDNKERVESVIKAYSGVLALRPFKEILLSYHNLEANCKPQFLKFDGWDEYNKFFGEDTPRDLLAVWDNRTNKWVLCIGTMAGESDPTAVEMICTTENRPLQNLPWEMLHEKLRLLFCEDPQELRNCGMDRVPL